MAQNKAPKAAAIERSLRYQDLYSRLIRKFPYAGTEVRHGFLARPGATLCQLCLGWCDDFRHM